MASPTTVQVFFTHAVMFEFFSAGAPAAAAEQHVAQLAVGDEGGELHPPIQQPPRAPVEPKRAGRQAIGRASGVWEAGSVEP